MLALFLAAVWFAITIDGGPTAELCTQLDTARESLRVAGWQGVDVFYEANCVPERTTPTTTDIAGLQLKTAPESDGGLTYGRWMYEQNGGMMRMMTAATRGKKCLLPRLARWTRMEMRAYLPARGIHGTTKKPLRVLEVWT